MISYTFKLISNLKSDNSNDKLNINPSWPSWPSINPACRGCRALNVPSKLLECLTAQRDAHGGYQALLMHMSTDQVYDGSHSLWGEQDTCAPVNAYGLTKREAEVAIQVRKGKRNPFG